MKMLKIIIVLLCNIAYAQAEDGIVVRPGDVEVAAPNDELSRLSTCETDLQNLTGRVEVLEHAVKELQHGNASAPASHASAEAPAAVAVTEKIEHVASEAPAPLSENGNEKRDYDSALAALKESRFTDAENLFVDFMQKYPSSTLVNNAYFWYAESFYRRGEFEKAAVHYLKCYKQAPKSAKAADSLLKLALSLGEIKKTKDACSILAKLESEFKQRPVSSVQRAKAAKSKFGCK